MLDKAVNGVIAAILGVIFLGVLSIMHGVDTSLVNSFMTTAVDIIVRVGVAVIIVAAFVSIGKGLLGETGL